MYQILQKHRAPSPMAIVALGTRWRGAIVVDIFL
jgi:uncharacterized protein YejL (UPF0352 family)